MPGRGVPVFWGECVPCCLQSCSCSREFNSFTSVQVGGRWVLCKHVSVAMNGARRGQTGAPRDAGDRGRKQAGSGEQRCEGQPGDAQPQKEGTGDPRCAGLSRQSWHVLRGTVPRKHPPRAEPAQPCAGAPRDTRQKGSLEGLGLQGP